MDNNIIDEEVLKELNNMSHEQLEEALKKIEILEERINKIEEANSNE